MTLNVFFDAIRRNPEDDIPRLALAKHLEELGDPRGELLRLQIQLTKMPADAPERRDTLKRMKKLRWESIRWLPELPAPEERAFGWPSWSCEMQNGRLTVEMSADVFLGEAAQRLVGSDSWGWVELLSLREVHPDQLRDIADSPLLRTVLSLTVGEEDGAYQPLGDIVALALARSPHLSSLRGLCLMCNRIGPRGALALARSPHLGRLEALDLSNNFLCVHGAAALGRSESLNSLQTLDLANNSLRDEGLLELARSPAMSKLTELRLTSNDIRDIGVTWLTTSPHIQGLVDLDLGRNTVSEFGCGELAGSANVAKLRSLNLASNKNQVGPRGRWRWLSRPT